MWVESADGVYWVEERPASAPISLVNLFLVAAIIAVPVVAFLVMLKASDLFAATAADAPRTAQATAAKQTKAAAPLPISGDLAPFFTPEVQHWRAQIVRWGDEYGLNPNLIATVMQIESCGNPRAVSGAGAMGLFQVMPFHFAAGEDPFDPETNARRGLGYLKAAMVRSNGNVSLALAGYNGGLGVIGLPQSLWPAETRRYVAWGEPIYRDAVAGKKHSAALQNWYRIGGRSMCIRARIQLGMKK